ncbi:MAG: isocitrate lyase [Candidatus Limnocylindria bacterium]
MTAPAQPRPSTARPVGAPDGPAPDPEAAAFEARVAATRAWMAAPRFAGITRLHTARDVVEQQGTIEGGYAVARDAAAAFHGLLRTRFAERRAITTFGPYSPSQAVTQKRLGIEAIYLGGWATSAKGSALEDPGPDLASYPLSAVPEEAAGIVRALLTADRNQAFTRSRMTEAQRQASPPADFRPFIIADADTGHGGDAHVRNLIRRFVEVGVPGYHIEDQRPGAKKCGHQDGKVLVAVHEQLKRLNAARFQLDIMGVPGIIVARTDAEAATLLDDRSDERDAPFLLGATARGLPGYRVGYLAIMRLLNEAGLEDARGHQLFAVPEADHRAAVAWLDAAGVADAVRAAARDAAPGDDIGTIVEALDARFAKAWSAAAGLMTRDEAADLGVAADWDPELPRTVDGYYRVRGGIDFAIARSIAAAPFADLLWMETKTADLADARRFADAVHAVYPDAMLAYNLSPSFNWDTTGMSDEEMRRFPEELGRLGFVFDFITYGGHQVDGLAAEEFAAELQRDGMLALARLQRRLRLRESPYRTPQALVGGARLDAALSAATGRTASTQAMGAASTHHQHLVPIEAPPALLERWLAEIPAELEVEGPLRVRLRPRAAWSDGFELRVLDGNGATVAEVAATELRDRDGRRVLSLTDQLTSPPLRRQGLMTLIELYLLHRTGAERVHHLAPTAASTAYVEGLQRAGLYASIDTHTPGLIVVSVDRDRVDALVAERERAVPA